MDNSPEFTVLEVCAGYGGVSEGLRNVIPNLRVVAYVEIEAFACANLVAKAEKAYMDSAPVWTDIKTFPAKEFYRKVDCLTAGYPCQPFSTAGLRRGAEDERHLWPHIKQAISVIRPRFVFLENVAGHISLGLREVLTDLACLGYRVENDRGEPAFALFSAAEVGAPHERKRVFILAVADAHEAGCLEQCGVFTVREKQFATQCGCNERWPSRPNEQQYGWEPPRTIVDDSNYRRLVDGSKNNGSAKRDDDETGAAGKTNKQNRKAQSPLGRDFDGTADWMVQSSSRIDELRLLGNGCCIPTVSKAFRTLYERMMG